MGEEKILEYFCQNNINAIQKIYLLYQYNYHKYSRLFHIEKTFYN